MAIELPGEFVWVMNLLGLNWPQVNEDKVREFADHVRDFGISLDTTHQAATTTIKRMGEAYQANCYEQLVAKWSRMTDSRAAEAAEAVLIEATKKVVNAILQQVEQQIIGDLIEKAVAPLESVVEKALGGLVFKGLDAALGDPTASGGAGTGDGFRIHATRFSAATAGMSFS